MGNPDWSIIIWVSVGFILVVLIIIASMQLFKKYGWEALNHKTASYRQVTLNKNMLSYISKEDILRNAFNKKFLTEPETLQNISDLSDPSLWKYSHQEDLSDFSSTKIHKIMKNQADKLLEKIE